jgi:vancomycin permeability regulator SanA
MYNNKLVLIRRIALILFSLYMISVILILADGFLSTYEKAEYAVVLGSQVHESGEPSARLITHLDKAIEIYNNGDAEIIIVSGGIGKEGFNEAIVMADYLRQKGVRQEKIIIDSMGYNTLATAQNLCGLIGEDKSIIAVSQFFHLPRVRLVFRKVGFKNVGAAYPSYYELRDIYSLLREVPAYILYMVRDT